MLPDMMTNRLSRSFSRIRLLKDVLVKLWFVSLSAGLRGQGKKMSQESLFGAAGKPRSKSIQKDTRIPQVRDGNNDGVC